MTFAPTQPPPAPNRLDLPTMHLKLIPVFSICTSSIIHLVCPPPPSPNFSYLCFSFLLGINVFPRVIKNNAYAQFLGGKQGVLWEMSKWQNSPPPVQPRFKNLCQEFYLEAQQTLSLTGLSRNKPFSYSKGRFSRYDFCLRLSCATSMRHDFTSDRVVSMRTRHPYDTCGCRK